MHVQQLLAYSETYQGSTQAIQRALKHREPFTPIDVKLDVLTILDENYPKRLKRLTHPPYVLYVKGNPNILKGKSLGLVGSRHMGTYAALATDELVKGLPKDWTIVSGLARGVDGCAHRNALHYGLPTLGVCAFGFDSFYPPEHRKLAQQIEEKGCLISQYPPSTPIAKFRFVERNLLIAALSDQLVVMQAGLKSGTMSTVNAALELGIDVHCLPYRLYDREGEGNNALIQQGAYILTKVDELIKL